MANFEEFLTPRRAGGPGSTLRVKYFAKAFFLLLKERKRITVTLSIFFLFLIKLN
jgi:hypothetical protein